MLNYLTTEDVVEIHAGLTLMFKDDDPIEPPGVRDENLLGSAISRPATGFAGQEKYRTIEQKAGALLHSLAKNHAFHNGNKRTAFMSMLVFMERNGRRLSEC